ncbi:Ig-like domain-containing protein [Bradyrhizobium brasilense]|uniref:Ig-like domain-containing protein n=1 Tax=Bradyrhizobium brasilense TaxID=1419277 RepID=UPI0024B0DE26|nr:Ig-like domain-containing protein [Bradyrhizobium australafricanum]WFU32409.1 Ig-like domain-containing protein [Bradyrhizobium australafricanum]
MTTSPYWGTFAFPWSQPVPGPHIYPPNLAVNTATGTLEFFYGFTPNGSDTLFRYAVQLDSFFLPLPPLSSSTDGYAFVDASRLFQYPLHQNLILANTGPNSVEGIAILQTQDQSGSSYIDESFITGGDGTLSAGPNTQVAGPLTGIIENTIFEPFRTTAGLLSSYGVAWDQYNPSTGAYSISFEMFNHNSGDPNFDRPTDYTPTGIVTLNEGTFTSESSLPLWTFAAAGGAYVLASSFSFSGHDSILVNGYNLNGFLKTNGFTFRIDPDLNAFPSDTNHITLERDAASGALISGSLRLVQQSSPGNFYAIAWNESITDGNGNVVGNQVEFVIFQPLVGVVARHTFQTSGTAPEKVRLQLESNSVFVLAYGDDTATNIVRFDTSGNVFGTATDSTDHLFDSIAVLGDGRVAVLYDNALDPSSTSQIVSHVFDFRTGVNINDFSVVDGNNKYVAGTQFSDFFIGESNVLNEFYDIDGIPFSPNFDSFTGGANGFNVAIFPSARSNYVISELAGDLIINSKTNSGHFLQAANVQELAFNPIVEPAPQAGVIDVTGGGVYLRAPLSNGLSAIIAGSTLELASPLTSTGEVTFSDFGTSTLRLDYPGSFQGTISGLLPGDIIGLAGLDPSTTTALFDGSTLLVHTMRATFQYHVTGATAGGTFRVQTDGIGGTNLVFESSANHPPVASNIFADANEDTNILPVTLAALFTDADLSDTFTFSTDTTGTIGKVTNNSDGSFAYDPNGKFESLGVGETATDTFTYTVADNHGASSTATATVTIHGENDAPAPLPDFGHVQKGKTLSISAASGVLANDRDVDAHDALQVLKVNGAEAYVGHTIPGRYGTLKLNSDGSYLYSPGSKVGTDTFVYTVSDGHGGTVDSTLNIAVEAASVSNKGLVFSIAYLDADKNEGTNETTAFTFTVTLSGPITDTTKVDWSVAAGLTPSVDLSDFGLAAHKFPSGTVIFNPGDSSTKTISVPVFGDSLPENGGRSEDFAVTLSHPTAGATIDPFASSAQGHIHDDDLIPFLGKLAGAAYHLAGIEKAGVFDPPGGMLADSLYSDVSALPGFHLLTSGDQDLSSLKPAPTGNPNFPTKGIDHGIYVHENAAALVGTSDDSLYLAFRGTNDVPTTGIGQLSDFFASMSAAGTPDANDWWSMDEYYFLYDDLFTALRNYIKDPTSHIDHVYVTGFSLGSAMAQQFMSQYAGDARFEAVTFADPGFLLPSTDSRSFGPDGRIINVHISGDAVGDVAINSLEKALLADFTHNAFGVPYKTLEAGDDLIVSGLSNGSERVALHDLATYESVANSIGDHYQIGANNFDLIRSAIDFHV